MKNLAKELLAVTTELKALSRKTAELAKAVEKTKKAKPAAKKKSSPVKKQAKKTKPMTPTDQVLKIMKRFKKGVNVTTLRDKSGFNEKQISNIVHRASKSGKMKRVGRGLYSVFGL